MPTTELLAPAGNMEALHAAVRSGADAVYLGLETFNARRGAENFTPQRFAEACDYAHLRGVNIYVTLNTAILPNEVSRALEAARQAWRSGADAFIVQDIGIAAELGRTLPEARLHVSTQMNTHNEAGIRAAARLGAKRVTLARELSVPEIAHLCEVAKQWDMEVETFIHGALCVGYSGQCFMSSMIGGRSANRGMCAQACRLPYELHNRAERAHKALPAEGEHLLSPKDLCAIDLLPQLVEAGVSSFKIEGRMKSPEYVQAVVSVYRFALDRVLANVASDKNTDVSAANLPFEPSAINTAPVATEEERKQLTEAFSRGFTTAYLEGSRGNSIMSYQRPNNRGAFMGRIEAVKQGKAFLATKERILVGDVLEFWTGKGRTTHTVSGPDGEVPRDAKGCVVLPLDPKERAPRVGDRVFRVRSAAAVFVDNTHEPRVPLQGRAELHLAKPFTVSFSPAQPSDCESVQRHIAQRLAEEAASQAASFVAEGRSGMFKSEVSGDILEPARTKALTKEDVSAHIDRLGSTPYELKSLSVALDAGIGLGFSRIHQLRSEALDKLSEKILSGKKNRQLPRVEERKLYSPLQRKSCSVVAWATNPACARTAKRAGAETIYVPVLNYRRGEATVTGQRSGTAEQGSYPKNRILVLPTIDHDAQGFSREAVVGFDPWKSVETEQRVLVESLGDLQHAAELGLQVEVGPHLPITNRLSLEQAVEFGAVRVWLSPELTLEQIRTLAKDAPCEIGLTVAGAQELMITEHCLLMSQGSCDEKCAACARRKSPHYLKDRKGFEFPVITDLCGRSHLYNSVPLDVVHALPELISAGVTTFMVDATLMNSEVTAQTVGRTVRALKVALTDGNPVAKQPHATSGHLFRGVS